MLVPAKRIKNILILTKHMESCTRTIKLRPWVTGTHRITPENARNAVAKSML